jgi:hypothetical protein
MKSLSRLRRLFLLRIGVLIEYSAGDEARYHGATPFSRADIQRIRTPAGAITMLTECFNPACRKRLDYLRDGRVVRVIRHSPSGLTVEHYWLCGNCYGGVDFEFKPDGTVTLCRRAQKESPGAGSLVDYLAG